MANLTDIVRLNYYEGEYLGAVDFEAEQVYHRDMRRRHNVGAHSWGIIAGSIWHRCRMAIRTMKWMSASCLEWRWTGSGAKSWS